MSNLLWGQFQWPPRRKDSVSAFLFCNCLPLIVATRHIVVCGDACFTQKRTNNPSNPDGVDNKRTAADTIFLTVGEVEEWRAWVEHIRPPRPPGKSRSKRPPEDVSEEEDLEDDIVDEEDHYEGDMKIPASVLALCGQSYTAANEAIVKAQLKYFADTGVMGLLCRHDRMLYIVNMTTPGKSQFYFFALVAKLFAGLPLWMTVGVLYDIACQTHRSCVKFKFLGEYLDRITWAVSAFHAYGHQWACQIIYHPRKIFGFGLSEGEGSERFWSLIKMIIAICRVSGVCLCFSLIAIFLIFCLVLSTYIPARFSNDVS